MRSKKLSMKRAARRNRYEPLKSVIMHAYHNCRDVMVKAMDCGIVVREFICQSRYYVHFRADTLGKGMNPLILPALG